MKLTKAQLDFHAENGYLVIDNFFTKDEINDFRESTRNVIRAFIDRAKHEHPDKNINIAKGEEFDAGTQTLNDIEHDYIADIYDTICHSPEFFRIAGKKETAQVLNQILARNPDAPLFGFKNRCRIDPPRDDRRTTGWHQQVFYGVPEAAEFMQTWAPLIHDTNQGNGTLEIAIGSHKSGVPKQHWIEEADRVVQILVDDQVVNRYPHKIMDMSVGQILVFSGKTVHRSGNNTSKQTRYSLVGEYYNVNDVKFTSPRPKREFRNMSMRKFFDKVAATW